MLTKILVTIFVIAGIMFYLRNKSPSAKKAVKTDQYPVLRYISLSLIVIALLSCGVYLVWSGYDGNQIVSITLVSPVTANSQVYRARRADISANEIKTLDGTVIRLSNQERVIIASLR